MDPATFHLADRIWTMRSSASVPFPVRVVRLASSAGMAWFKKKERQSPPNTANIIQHPGGERKQLTLRENRIVDVLPEFLHYTADTEGGSSGSPVYNDRWGSGALHHSGVWKTNAAGEPISVDGPVWRPEMGENRIQWLYNEGIRVSVLL